MTAAQRWGSDEGERTRLSDILPTADLVVRLGEVELRAITDDVLCGLIDLARDGIHPPDEMPFYRPWSQAAGDALAHNTAAYHWSGRAAFRPEAWDLQLAVFVRGDLVGCQGIATHDFLVTRTGETGSWLGAAHQGKGIGTTMRRALCAMVFDDLGAQEITSGAFADNPASLAVSRKVGYAADGAVRTHRVRAGIEEVAINHRLVLRPETFVRGDVPVEVSGVEPLRRAIGLTARA